MYKRLVPVLMFLLFVQVSLAQTQKPRLNHTAIFVKDIKVSTDFYENIIGLTKIDEPFKDNKHTWFETGPKMALHIIEGASEGKGLGIRFLKHIERNSLLLFLIPADSKSIQQEYDILINELQKYNPELLDKKRILAITKSDMLDEELRTALQLEVPKKIPSVFISSLANQGLIELKDLIWKALH